MADIKLIGAVTIMIACFAVIYPRFMHPLVLRAFGANDKENENNVHPPNFNNPNQPHQPKKGSADDIRRHMRGGPHPGMHAAAEMQKQQSQQGSGRGMMGVVLPMYAIGIVLYLIYTLFKVFNKSKGNKESSMYRDRRGPYSRSSMQQEGFPAEYEGNDAVQSFLHDQNRRQDLEDLLSKVDDKNVSTEEMRVLQKRLEETEAQMSRILQAMQSVQSNMGGLNVPQQPMQDDSSEAVQDDKEPKPEDGNSVNVEDDNTEQGGESADETNTERSSQEQNDSKTDDKEAENDIKLEHEDEVACDDGQDRELVGEKGVCVDDGEAVLLEEKGDENDKLDDGLRQRNISFEKEQ